MNLSAPLVFEPLFMERVWGGRRLETRFGKRLPQSSRIGESWEIVDRPEAQSVVHAGPYRGLTLHDLWTDHREAIFGRGLPDSPRFPLLCKLIDAQDRLSVQVHPPAEVAARFAGEPKTEMWYVLEAVLESSLYAGLKEGVTRESFLRSLEQGAVADQIHQLPVHEGDAILMPSGRVHAIGAGNIIVEVQQNSDTTYRVFDWNRLGVDGRPRDLHVEQSLASIDFEDHAPELASPSPAGVVTECEFFRVERWELAAPREADPGERFAIFVVVAGVVACAGIEFSPASFFLTPPAVAYGTLTPVGGPAAVLRVTIPG